MLRAEIQRGRRGGTGGPIDAKPVRLLVAPQRELQILDLGGGTTVAPLILWVPRDADTMLVPEMVTVPSASRLVHVTRKSPSAGTRASTMR